MVYFTVTGVPAETLKLLTCWHDIFFLVYSTCQEGHVGQRSNVKCFIKREHEPV